MNISYWKNLKNWYAVHKRDLPWRHTREPYLIWISEVILQQTRVNQGLPYFYAFVEEYPTVHDLANTDINQLFRIWQGLGYYSRAKNMHYTAQVVVSDYNGIFPSNFDDLIKLKGIGKYTAAAIASFASNEDVAVVDGNVTRVISRLFNIQDDVLLASTKKKIESIAQQILPKGESSFYNQAIMELGALVCKPQNPLCEQCPIVDSCIAFREKNQLNLPIKIKKIKRKIRYFNYIVALENDGLWMHRRNRGDIWENLYDFILIESSSKITDINSLQLPWKDSNGVFINQFSIKHVLTHQDLYITFWVFDEVKIDIHFAKEKNLVHLPKKDLGKYPKPIVISNFIQKQLKF